MRYEVQFVPGHDRHSVLDRWAVTWEGEMNTHPLRFALTRWGARRIARSWGRQDAKKASSRELVS